MNRRALALAGTAYSLLTIAIFRPSAWTLWHTVPEVHGWVADGLLYVWALGHVSSWLTGARSGPLFDAAIYHPLRDTLAFSDHMIGQSLLGLGLTWWTRLATGSDVGNPVFVLNVVTLASYPLGALAACALASRFVRSPLAAFGAGIVFAFTPLRLQGPVYPQELCSFFMPVAIGAWLGFVERQRLRDWVAWVVAWCAHSLMGMYLAVYFGVVMCGMSAAAVLFAAHRRTRRLVLGTMLAPLALVAVLWPTLQPYLRLRVSQQFVRTFGLDTFWIAVLPAPGTLLGGMYGQTELIPFGPGVAVVLLAAVGIIALLRQRSRQTEHPTWPIAVGLGLALSLLLIPIRLQQHIPALDMTRTTYRSLHVDMLFIAVLVGLAMAAIEQSLRTLGARRAAQLAIIAVLIADMGTPELGRRRVPIATDLPPLYRRVAELRDEAAIHDDARLPDAQALSQYLSLFDRKPRLLGYSGLNATWTKYAEYRLRNGVTDAGAQDFLRRVHIDYVVLHRTDAPAAVGAAASLRAAGFDAELFGSDLLVKLPPPANPAPHAPPLTTAARAGWQFAGSAAEDGGALRDGDDHTAWTIVDMRTPPSLTIDLGAPALIGAVRCAPTTGVDRMIFNTALEGSTNGLNWQLVPAVFEPDDWDALVRHPATLRYYEARFPPRPLRWLRLTNQPAWIGHEPWTIAELDVLAQN